MNKQKNVQPQVDTERKKEHTSVLEKIRRRTGLLVGIVGLALVIFILESLLGSGASIFGGNEMAYAGTINGKKIDRNEFISRYEMQINNYRQRNQGRDVDEGTRTQAIETTWQQYIIELVMKPQFSKIGINVGEDELYETVVVNPVQTIVQNLTDPNTGKVNEQFSRPDGTLDPVKWRQAVQSVTGDNEVAVRNMEEQVKNTRYFEKFRSLVNKGLYVTKAEAKENFKNQDTKVSISYAVKRFDSVSDSTIKVTDSDLQKYYNDNSFRFMNMETTRSIEYVAYDVMPSAEDLAAIEKNAQETAAAFKGKNIHEDSSFMAQESENGMISMQDFTKKTMIVRDSSIFTSAPGTVFGPYNEGAYFKIYKLEEVKAVADSGKVRHILIAYAGAERSEATRTKDQAKKLSDSLVTLIKKGGSFDQFVEQFSDDGGKKKPVASFADPRLKDQLSQILFNVNDTNSWRGRGGNYGWIKATGSGMAEAFVKGATEQNKGDLIIKESQFGYHIMEVLDISKTRFNNYKVAQIFKAIAPSDETNQRIFATANQFAGENNTGELFDKGVTSQKLVKRMADNIKEGDYQIAGLDGAKELVKWVYTANKGDVNIFTLTNKHVVAKISGIRNKGILPLEEVKAEVTAKVIQQKKTEMFTEEFKNKAAGAKTVEEIASKLGVEAKKADNINYMARMIDGLGPDNIMVGTAIGSKIGNVTKPIAGNNGVFVLSVLSANSNPLPPTLKDLQMEAERTLGARSDYEVFTALKDMSDIEFHKSRID